VKTKKIIVFDLDDTLYNEIDFLKSAFYEIARKIEVELCIESEVVLDDMLVFFKKKKNIFKKVVEKYNSSYTIDELLGFYRNHKPLLKLSQDRQEVLNTLKNNEIPMVILTDGRSIQQRNKIKALGLNAWFSEIIISEEFGSEEPKMKINKPNFWYYY
jgi:putative hydrolase of the HAD superfamily